MTASRQFFSLSQERWRRGRRRRREKGGEEGGGGRKSRPLVTAMDDSFTTAADDVSRCVSPSFPLPPSSDPSASLKLDSRRTRRSITGDESASLEQRVATKREALVADRLEAPRLRERAAALRDEARRRTARYQFRQAKDLVNEAVCLEREAGERESMCREQEFERTTVTYLRRYESMTLDGSSSSSRGGLANSRDSVQVFVRRAAQNNTYRSRLLDEFLIEMDEAPPKVAMAVRDDCPSCGAGLLRCCTRSLMVCPKCGYSVVYLDATSACTSFDEVVEYGQYSYKRINHYSMWILLSQGKEAHRVPTDVVEIVMRDLYDRQGLRRGADVTHASVRLALRRQKLKRAYDHVVQITERVSGRRAPRISSKTERVLKNMFLQMQPAFLRHAPKTRTNFLSYPYVLYRSYQILGMDHMLDGLTLLKGRDKLEANDAIFRRMCEDLGWPVFELPSSFSKKTTAVVL